VNPNPDSIIKYALSSISLSHW